MYALATLAAALGAWEIVASQRGIDSVLLPAPSAVWSALSEQWPRLLFVDLPASLRRVGVGAALGCICGCGAGLLFLNPRARTILRPFVELLRPIPPLAWIPLSLLWFGFGDPPAYFLVSLGAFFPMLNATYLGFSRCETIYERAARSLGLSLRQTLLRVLLPQALPTILSGLRVSLGVAWMIVVTAELVGAQTGLGYMIQISRAQLQTELVIGGMAIIGMVGYVLTLAVTSVERVLLPWRRTGRDLSPEVL